MCGLKYGVGGVFQVCVEVALVELVLIVLLVLFFSLFRTLRLLRATLTLANASQIVIVAFILICNPFFCKKRVATEILFLLNKYTYIFSS